MKPIDKEEKDDLELRQLTSAYISDYVIIVGSSNTRDWD